MTGAFITLEGGDGSGKSTQAGLLQAWLEDRGRTVVRTHEPGGTELGVEIRRLVQHTEGHVAPRAEALLFAADRAHHVATLVRPAIERGDVVVQDRYLDSSVAYQGAGRELDPQQVRDLSLWAIDGLLPHLTILLDIDPAVGRERMAGREHAPYDRLEDTGLDFAQRVRDAYLSLAEAEPNRFVVVDASAAPESVHASVVSHVRAMLDMQR
ncbi:dTMP kinase [Agrococcus sp. KRD186]|jgi:dTMP kinase|uniref:dTMP kinase n=1 Tax=Agrococcus sp. KRD186 TaxID=2729730 RepID=UPI0019D2BC5F|nr:dTMP kinase [Agrococcus sp. KRD186]